MSDRRRMDEIVSLIRGQLRNKVTDQDQWGKPEIASPLTDAVLASDEMALGFEVPPLLAHIYGEIGNGGFGPGYGLIGLTGGATDDLGMSLVQAYTSRLDWPWPSCVLPVCHWGCAIYSCIDCNAPDYPMRFYDPNVESDSLFDDALTLESWIEAWAKGVDLWNWSYRADSPRAKAIDARFGQR